MLIEQELKKLISLMKKANPKENEKDLVDMPQMVKKLLMI